MSAVIRTVRLEYSSFYIAGSRDVAVPAAAGGAPFAANRQCVNVGSRMWQDGEVEITLGRRGDVEVSGSPGLDRPIPTPERRVVLFDANHPELMRFPVHTRDTRIRVWTNHPTEPDRVVVVVGD